MHRLPLADELPYQFIEPKVGAFWLWLGRLYSRTAVLRREQGVVDIDFDGLGIINELLDRGDGVLLTPNHQGHADCPVMLEMSRKVDRAFYFMAAYQIFRGHGGLAKFMLPRIGAFPVDREGSDLRAFKTGVDLLARGGSPLVIFPEGEIYHMGDKLTPIREGAAAVATNAAKRAAERDKTVWIVPVALKYRFVDGNDPMPELLATMDRLESRFTWQPRTRAGLVDRIYSYAEAMLALKEMEYFGTAGNGPIKPRIAGLRDAILDGLEDRLIGKRRVDVAPVRAKEIRRACLDRLADPATTPEQKADLRQSLSDVFVAIQLYSYPGDYLAEGATVERVAETLMKFEQDILRDESPPKTGPRRAIVRLGPPIDVRERMALQARPRLAVAAITTELEASIQALLDAIGPGRPLPGVAAPTPVPPRIRAALAG